MPQSSKFPTPGLESRFFVAPASDKALRRYKVILFLTPAFLLFVIVDVTVTKDWWWVLFGLLLVGSLAVIAPFRFELSTERFPTDGLLRTWKTKRPADGAIYLSALMMGLLRKSPSLWLKSCTMYA